MAFVLHNDPLSVRRALRVRIDQSANVIPAAAVATYRQAEEIVADAYQQAEAIVGRAQAGYDAECQRGYQAGIQQALQEQSEQMIEHVGRTVEYFSSIETRMVDLVLGAVQKIVADFDDRDRVLNVVRNALSVIRNQRQMTLRLNPGQIDTVRASIDELLSLYPGVGYLDLVSDPRIAADACILESEIGVVESSIEGQLQALRAAFGRILGSRT